MRASLYVALAALMLPSAAFAQSATAAKPAPAPSAAKPAAAPAANSGPPNALQGFSQNRNQPVQIEAATLEVRDKDKQATFSGNVHVIQGDTNLRSKVLVVFYEQKEKGAGNTLKAAQPGPGGQQAIKRLEAKGGVVVTQKDQTATGETGIFEMKTNTVTLLGNVVMTQGQNVLKGERLTVDLTSGVSKVESGNGGTGRVQGLFNSGKEGAPAGGGTSMFPGMVKPPKTQLPKTN